MATIEDEKRDNTLTIVRGVLDLDHGKISDNILTLSLAELIKTKSEAKEAPEQAADAPEIGKTQETAQKRARKTKTDKDTTEPLTAGKTENPAELTDDFVQNHLPWEKDMKDGTGIEVEKTGDGVKVTARYFEQEPAKPAGPTPEQTAKENLLNFEMEL